MKYFKKISKNKKRVMSLLPDPVAFFKKPSIPRTVFFKVNKVEYVKESEQLKLSLS